MTTSYYNTLVAQTSDAAFRAWITAFSASLDAVGLTATADTGQINPATAVRPATNTAAGYEIRTLTCSGAPTLYLKFEYGAGSAIDRPAIWITAGTGSDGAGNITGTNMVRKQIGNASALLSTTNLYPTYVCRVDGCFWFLFKGGSVGTNSATFFFVSNSVNDDGSFDSDSWFTMAKNTNTTPAYDYQSVRVATNQIPWSLVGSVDPGLCYFIGSVTSSNTGVDLQAYRWYYPAPRIRPIFGLLGMFNTEIALDDTVTTNPVALTNRTFRCLGAYVKGASFVGSASTLLAIWE